MSKRVGRKPKLYVGCGLTLAPQEFKDEVERLKEALSAEWDIMHFLGLTKGTAADVYEVDILRNVGGCDAFVGIMDEPSWGLGYETREALLQGKPTLLVANEKARITRLALGAAEFTDLTFRTYQHMVDDVPTILKEEFASVLHANS